MTTSVTGLRAFRLVLVGQSLALIGSGLTNFALSVWTYELTHSTTQFALVAACGVFPGLLFSPVAGAFIDRVGARASMALSNVGTLVGAAVLTALVASDGLEIWHVYVVAALTSLSGSFCWPAFGAATTLLVAPQHLGRASGAALFGDSAAQLLAPALGGFLFGIMRLEGVLWIELLCASAALSSLALSSIPRPSAIGRESRRPSLVREIGEAWSYVAQRRGLVALMGLSCIMELLVSFLEVLSAPIVLAAASSSVLGVLRSVAGAGMIAGSVAFSLWGGPQRRVVGLIAFQTLVGVHVVWMGLTTTPWLIGLAGFGGLFFIALVQGCSQVLWQTNVTPSLQGRVFALRRISGLVRPVGYLVAGLLADGLLEPYLREASVTSLASRVVGVGPGRGSALLLVAIGSAAIVATLLSRRYRPLRELETEGALPDPAAAAGVSNSAGIHPPTRGELPTAGV